MLHLLIISFCSASLWSSKWFKWRNGLILLGFRRRVHKTCALQKGIQQTLHLSDGQLLVQTVHPSNEEEFRLRNREKERRHIWEPTMPERFRLGEIYPPSIRTSNSRICSWDERSDRGLFRWRCARGWERMRRLKRAKRFHFTISFLQAARSYHRRFLFFWFLFLRDGKGDSGRSGNSGNEGYRRGREGVRAAGITSINQSNAFVQFACSAFACRYAFQLTRKGDTSRFHIVNLATAYAKNI